MDFFTLSGLLPALIATLIALAFAHFLVRDLASTQAHEFTSIDGLRGFLALAVFLHHAIFWYSYAKSGNWFFYSSVMYMNFGHVSVNLFFMLTGFLFSLKLIDGRKREVDWLKLYCSRFMRLTPLYLCLIMGVFAIVAINTRFIALQPTEVILVQLRDWLLFGIPSLPNINTFFNTHLITAGVIWTLPYEWYFYFLLPILGLVIGTQSRGKSSIWIILSIACVLSFSAWKLDSGMFYCFFAGGLAAAIVRTPQLRQPLSGKAGNIVAIACFIAAYTCFDNYMSFASLFITWSALLMVACGNGLFGLLTCRPARALSCISYGIYLLQGLVLYVVMIFCVNTNFRLTMNEHQYWMLLLLVVTPTLVTVSALSWHFIESPAIQFAPKLAQWIRTLRKPPASVVAIPSQPAKPIVLPSSDNTQSKESSC